MKMREMTGRERSIRTMNFEPTDRLPIMANMLPPEFVQKVTHIPEEDYWANQLDAHIQSMKVMGMDFHVQNWFPVREEAQREWSPGQFDRWRDIDVVVEHMEQRAAQMEETWHSLSASPQEREKRIQEICDYQIQIQSKMGDDLLWVFDLMLPGRYMI
jgi:hypothetical protein